MKTLNKSMCFLLVYCLQGIQCLNCTFESGLCAWEPDASDHFNWTRYRGNTPSEYTGPTSDHTSGDGYYIYIESSPPRETGEKARLISPQIKPGSYCLVFWYFVYGERLATLNVYKKSETVNNDTSIFQRKGNASFSEWRKGLASLRYSDEFQIVFEGVVGGPKGDIAIDDISLTNGMCPADCDFDIDLCNWTQENEDDFDWIRFSGSSPTSGTGPLNDHTGGGQYVFIETSYPRSSGDRARLESPGQGPGAYCLKFWYSMYGRHINRLNVYKKTDGGNESQLISLQNATSDFNWTEHVYNFQVEANYQIVFEGVCGDGYEGDIAVDDISLIPGRCVTESTYATSAPISTQGQISENNSPFVSRVTETTDDTTHGILTNTLTLISPSFTTTAVVGANRTLPLSTLNMTGYTSTNSLLSNLSTLPIVTNLQDNSNSRSTRDSEKSAPLTTPPLLLSSKNVYMNTNVTHNGLTTGSTRRETYVSLTMLASLTPSTKVLSTHTTNHVFYTGSNQGTEKSETLITYTLLSPSKVITNSHEKSHTSNIYTWTTDAKLLITSTGLPPLTCTLITSSSPVLTETLYTDKPNVNTVTEIKENSLVTLYTALIAVTSTLVILVIALFIFMCRRRQEKSRITVGCRDDMLHECSGFNENTFKNKKDSKFHSNDIELCQEQYTEVSLECIQPATTEDEILESEYSVTVFNTKQVNKGQQAYNHIQVQKRPFIDSTYSHISHTFGNHCEALEKESTKYPQIADAVSDLDINEDNRVAKANYGIETVSENCLVDNQDIMYDHLSAGRKSNTTQKDDYCHLTNISKRGNSRDHNHGYATVIKKKGRSSVFEFFEKCEEEERNGDSSEDSQDEDNCQMYTIKNVDIKDNNDINHDYFILEKLDN